MYIQIAITLFIDDEKDERREINKIFVALGKTNERVDQWKVDYLCTFFVFDRFCCSYSSFLLLRSFFFSHSIFSFSLSVFIASCLSFIVDFHLCLSFIQHFYYPWFVFCVFASDRELVAFVSWFVSIMCDGVYLYHSDDHIAFRIG